MTSEEIKLRLINNDALFNNTFVIEQDFDIVPNTHPHYGASITYQDLTELRRDFLLQLVDTVIDWVYGSSKFAELQKLYVASGKSLAAASSEIIRKAKQKFRRSDDKLLIQGQLGELLLFHFIQRTKQAVPLLRKMPITTSSSHERFGADAIHYKIRDNKNIIILGEAKAYTSSYKFSSAFENAINSILDTYENLRTELNLYLHEDFLDAEMNRVAEAFLTNKLSNVEIELVSLVLYNETTDIKITNEQEIKNQITQIICERYSNFDKSKIDLDKHPILRRITYIVFPVWKLDEIADEFQKMI